MTALSGIVQNYTQLLLAWLGVGLGEAGGSPPSHSMLSDYFPEEQRGTYAGVAHPSVIAHLQKLGVTAIELMPVHQFVQDSTLLEQGLRNY